ncbi:cobalt-precorrin-6A reductase [Actinoplanes sp. NPDC049265]|uniref:cobalt-precorrin-6A reductase n=1 Tax=Actinoplanes sp. NPDC049265 TaxID=3363902 RepID=UPI00371F06C1
MSRVLILGGTTEGRLLASACAGRPGVVTISSLAGRTSDPLIPAGELRIGGFGGVAGLVAYLRAERIDAVVDATHTFARRMTGHAVEACAAVGVPLLILRRPGWTEQPGDTWHRVPSIDAAAELLPGLGERIFLTTGRQEIAAFAHLDRLWFLARSVEPPEPPMPHRLEVLLDRGPFTVEGELSRLAEHRIDVLVTKDSGGAAAKLAAARARSIPVVLVDRPAPPPVPTVATVAEAVEWLRTAIDVPAGNGTPESRR